MSQASASRGVLSLGATLVFMLALSSPATARPDQGGSPPRSVSTESPSQREYECHYLSHCPAAGSPSTAQVLRIDDDALEFLQVGAGVAAGLALGGAGMILVARRAHGRTHATAA